MRFGIWRNSMRSLILISELSEVSFVEGKNSLWTRQRRVGIGLPPPNMPGMDSQNHFRAVFTWKTDPAPTLASNVYFNITLHRESRRHLICECGAHCVRQGYKRRKHGISWRNSEAWLDFRSRCRRRNWWWWDHAWPTCLRTMLSFEGRWRRSRQYYVQINKEWRYARTGCTSNKSWCHSEARVVSDECTAVGPTFVTTPH